MSPIWQHSTALTQPARAQSQCTTHDTRLSPLYINCDTRACDSSFSFANLFSSPSPTLPRIRDCDLRSSSCRRSLQLEFPVAMFSHSDTQLFADVPTGFISIDAAREQLKSFPVIHVTLEGLDQQFTESIAEERCVTAREFLLNAIQKFGPELSELYTAALLYSDEQPRCSRVRLQSGMIETAVVCHFRIHSMHAAQSLVNLYARRFRNRPPEHQPVARFYAFAREHELEIAARNGIPQFRTPVAAETQTDSPALATTTATALAAPAIFGCSSSSLHFSNFLWPSATQPAVSASSSQSRASSSGLFASPSFSVSLTPNTEARKSTVAVPPVATEVLQEHHLAAARDLDSLMRAINAFERSSAIDTARLKELKETIRVGVASAVLSLPTIVERTSTAFGTTTRAVPALLSHPWGFPAGSQMPPSATPLVLTPEVVVSQIAPHSTAEVTQGKETQSSAGTQEAKETRVEKTRVEKTRAEEQAREVELDRLLEETRSAEESAANAQVSESSQAVGVDASTQEEHQASAHDQSDDSLILVESLSTTPVPPAVVSLESRIAGDAAIVAATAVTVAHSSTELESPASPAPAIATTTSAGESTTATASASAHVPRESAVEHRPVTRTSKRAADAAAAETATSEKKSASKPDSSASSSRPAKSARLSTFTYAGSHSSDFSPCSLRIEFSPAAASTDVAERESRPETPFLPTAPSSRLLTSANQTASQPRVAFGEPAWDDDDEVTAAARLDTTRHHHQDQRAATGAAKSYSAWSPDAGWHSSSTGASSSCVPREFASAYRAAFPGQEAEHATSSEAARRSLDSLERQAQHTRAVVQVVTRGWPQSSQFPIRELSNRDTVASTPGPHAQESYSAVLDRPIAIIVLSTRFTFKKDGSPVDICRRVVVQGETHNLLDCRVRFQSMSALNPLPYEQMYPEAESRLPTKTYSELVHYLLYDCAGYFYVFHDRESTLEKLRIAIMKDRSVDVGRQMLLRNDALRAGAKIWYRSRSHLAPLRDLWDPLLHKNF